MSTNTPAGRKAYLAKFLSAEALAFQDYLWSLDNKQVIVAWDKFINPHKYDSSKKEYTQLEKFQAMRTLCQIDRVYLMSQILCYDDRDSRLREVLTNNWLYSRCREVEKDPDGKLDLWARGHFKSTIITKGGIIQEHLINPKLKVVVITFNVTFVKEQIFQYIKSVYETNILLKDFLFPDIFYQDPEKQAPNGKWVSDAIWLKANKASEPSLDFCSILKLNTGRHYNLRVYDDAITVESVTSRETIDKFNKAISDSKNIGTKGAGGPMVFNREWFIGTRYHRDDSYQKLIDQRLVIPRIYPATHNGKKDGRPVFLSKEEWEKELLEDDYVIACQQLQNPTGAGVSMFKVDYLRPYFQIPRNVNIFILVDSATSKNKRADYTSIAVIGMDNRGTKYILDGIRDKIEFDKIWNHLKYFYSKYTNMIDEESMCGVYVGYEKAAATRDIELLKSKQNSEQFYFDYQILTFPGEGQRSKADRIRRLTADFKQGKIKIPHIIWRDGLYYTWQLVKNPVENEYELRYFEINEKDLLAIEKKRALMFGQRSFEVEPLEKLADWDDAKYDYTEEFINELKYYPLGKHDDILDSISRIYDMEIGDLITVNHDRTAIFPEFT